MAIENWTMKNGEKRFRVKVKDARGTWFPSRTFLTKKEAMILEAKYIDLKLKGIRVDNGDATVTTVNDYWDVWSRENRIDVSDGWKKSQDQMYRDYVLPLLGKELMGDVGAPEIGHVFSRMKKLERSAQLRKHVYSLLRHMFGDAVEYYEMLPVNPVKPKFHRPKVAKTKRAFLSPTDAWKLLDHVRGHYAGPAIWIQTLAGFRVEAIIGLTWRNVLWDLNQILVCAAWKYKVRRMEAYPKGKDWEYFPMVPQLKEYLLALRALHKYQDDDFVCQAKGGGMLPYDSYEGALKRLCASAGVTILGTHELRHSCTEIWMHAGANQEDIRRLLGHKNGSTTLAYIHRTEDRLTRLAKSIGNEGNGNVFELKVPEKAPKSSRQGEPSEKELKVSGKDNE